jgi:hypothetical protein
MDELNQIKEEVVKLLAMIEEMIKSKNPKGKVNANDTPPGDQKPPTP